MTAPKPRITVRVDFSTDARLGPGKVALLDMIGRERSISAAARALGMSYRRAWLLVDSLNRTFRTPAVLTHPGRAQGGGAELTAFGRKLIQVYRAIERQAERATRAHVGRLTAARRAAPAKRKRPGVRKGAK